MELSPELNFAAFINLSGVLQCFLLAIISFAGPGYNRQINRLFGFFLFSMSLLFLDFIFYDQKIYAAVPILYGTLGFSIFFTPVLLYLYVKAYTQPDEKMNNWHFMHLVFPGLFTYLLIMGMLLVSREERLADFINDVDQAGTFDLEQFIFYIFDNVFYLAYWSTAFMLVRKAPPKVATRWLRWMMYTLLLMIVISGVNDFFPQIFLLNRALPYIFTIAVYSMVYFCIMHSPPFFIREKLDKYKKSGMTEELADRIIQKLQLAMDEQQLYLNSDLTLSDLARQLGISKHYLSQAMNEKLGVSFFQYINHKRIQEAAKRLAGNGNGTPPMTISQIAFAVGFNSLSAFNTAFKKQTGKSPSEYKTMINGETSGANI